MSQSSRSAEDAWKEAEALIQRIEQACRSDLAPERFFDELTVNLAATTKSAATSLWVLQSESRQVLSRCGLDVAPLDEDAAESKICDQSTAVPHAHWLESRDSPSPDSPSPDSNDAGRMIAVIRIDAESVLGLTLRLDQPIDLAIRQPLQELTQVVLELALTVYLRSQYRCLRQQLGQRRDRDALLGDLHDGVGIAESFAAISAAVAHQTQVDRVSLLRARPNRTELVATSTQPRVDRRARQARLLEQLATSLASYPAGVTFVVGDPGDVEPGVRDLLAPYLAESGCREIHVETFRDETDAPIAVIVMERFRLQSEAGDKDRSNLDSIRAPVQDAIRRAIGRDDAGWALIAGRLSRRSAGQKALAVLIAGVVAALLLWLIPAPLTIPAEGRLQASETRALFAPAEGVVTDVKLDSGDRVRQGVPIIVLRSPSLELHQKDLQGDLETAKTRLASIGALRSRASSGSTRDDLRASSGSADEQILKTQIAGLEEQLALVDRQIDALTVVSPIDGHVDRWNLKQTLSSRPVSHGQYLVDVVSTAGGWLIELELPDKHSRYVLTQQNRQPCRCTFRLSSGSDTVYESTVDQIANVAHLDARGQSMIRVRVPYNADDAGEFRVGSSVMAQIHCGNRALGFVWFRGLIEWTRRQTMF